MPSRRQCSSRFVAYLARGFGPALFYTKQQQTTARKKSYAKSGDIAAKTIPALRVRAINFRVIMFQILL